MTTIRPIDAERGLYEVSTSPEERSTWNVTRRFTISQWVGGGSYGQVCRGVDRDNGNAPVVIKRVSDVFQTSEDALRILREVAILRRLDHPNIVKVVDIIEPEPNTNPDTNRMRPFQVLYVVFQDGGGDLKMWLQMPEQQAVPLSADAVRSLMKQLVGAVGYLHRCRVVHRDIKPANILIDPATLTLRVADFGLSRIIEVSDQEEHQGHHHRVWNFERPRAPSVDDMDEASPVAAESFGNVEPLSRGDSGSFESDDSDVESDSPGLLIRNSTPVVVTSWYTAPNNPSTIINPSAFSHLSPLQQVPCPRDRRLPRLLQSIHRRLEYWLRLRRNPSLHAAQTSLAKSRSVSRQLLPVRNAGLLR
jgi:serine/threonine protein kinase